MSRAVLLPRFQPLDHLLEFEARNVSKPNRWTPFPAKSVHRGHAAIERARETVPIEKYRLRHWFLEVGKNVRDGYDTSTVDVVGDDLLYDDAKYDRFKREPYFQRFRSGEFEFVLGSIHTLNAP